MRWVLLLGVALALLAAPDAATAAQSFPHCAPGQRPVHVHGFAALLDLLGGTMGDPLECEHTELETGDAHQRTSEGLAFYRRRTNTPTFTNGWEHWALTTGDIVYWVGDSVDPPGDLAYPLEHLSSLVHCPPDVETRGFPALGEVRVDACSPPAFSGAGTAFTPPFLPGTRAEVWNVGHVSIGPIAVDLLCADGTLPLVREQSLVIRPVVITFGAGPCQFHVQGSERWSIRHDGSLTVEEAQVRSSLSFTGLGSARTAPFDPPVGPTPIELGSEGSYFVLTLVCGEHRREVRREEGWASGGLMLEFHSGPCHWEVETDGPWRIHPR